MHRELSDLYSRGCLSAQSADCIRLIRHYPRSAGWGTAAGRPPPIIGRPPRRSGLWSVPSTCSSSATA